MRFYEFEDWVGSWGWRGWLLALALLVALCAGLGAAEQAGWLPKGPASVQTSRPGSQ